MKFKTWLLLTMTLGLAAALGVMARAPQDEEDGTRRLWNQAFVAARAKTPPRPASHGTTVAPRPKPQNDLLGLTFWRLRPASATEAPEKARLLVQKTGSKPAELLPERTPADTTFKVGELVRLSLEAPRESQGFLYVIDREVYSDGSMGDPYLIFPT